MIGEIAAPEYRTSKREALEATATDYARAILTQRGISIPKEHVTVEFDYANDELRARAVVWQTGTMVRQRWGADRFDATGEALRFDIPHWDHISTVQDMSVSFAIAAE